jgi:phosphate:Na+ symporter
LAREKMDKNLFFSKEALDDLRGIQSIIFSMFDLTIHMLETADTTAMPKVSEMEATIDGLSRQVQAGHAKRLEEGKCTIESGLIFLDVINYLERIADHVYKVCMTLGEFGAGL